MSTTEGSTDSTDIPAGVDSAEARLRTEDSPDGPTDLPKRSWGSIFKRTVGKFSAAGATDLAAALTYYSVMSMFPALLALISLLGVFGQGKGTTDALLNVLIEMGATEEQLKPISDYITQMQGTTGAGVALFIGLAGALWAASNYVNAFSRAMNTIYGVKEGRPVWKLRPWMLLITLVVLLLVVLVALSLVFTGGFAQSVGSVIGLGDTAVQVWNWAKWPVMFLIVVLIVALLYWGTPNVRPPKFRWLSPGAVLAIVVWGVATAGFGFYVANFGNYNATYGALAGVIIMLLWLWLTNVALLFGAVFDSEMVREGQLQSGIPAEDEIQLPLRDASGAEKKADKASKQLAENRRIRLTAGRRKRNG